MYYYFCIITVINNFIINITHVGGVGEYGALPQNLRIISNFFKTAPDGSVRAFSTPNVHERNKNATTAARFMGFPVPERPNALVSRKRRIICVSCVIVKVELHIYNIMVYI